MLSYIDILIICIYLIFIMLIGYFSSKKNKTQADFLLASQSMPWIPIAFSVAATMISANTFIGAPGWSYKGSIAPFMTNITVPFAIFFAMYITMPIFYHMKVTSIYEYTEKRFGKYTRFLAIIQFFINSLIQVSSMVFIPSLIIQIITGFSLFVIVPIVVVISIIYTIVGGIRAVIWTDFIQMIIVWVSAFSVTYLAIKGTGLSFSENINIAKEIGRLDALDFSFDLQKTTAFFPAVFGAAFLWIRYFSFDQVQVQRVLTATSIESTKKSLALSALLMNIIFFLMLIIGVILTKYYNGKDFETANHVMINFILEELPIGLVGIVVAGTLASAMSSVDSLLNSLTTVFIKDVYEKYKPNKKTEETPLKTTMIIASIFGVIIVLFVLIGFTNSISSIIDIVGKYISYFSGPACGIFLLGFFSRKSNDKGVALGSLIGIILTIYIAKNYNTGWTVNPAIGALITIVLGKLLSLFFKDKNEYGKNYTARAITEEIKSTNKSSKVNVLPYTFGKYEIISLSFFFAQFIILYLLR